ncbi:hypothetical protein G6F48_006061 [Rhizopus delemar]|nr:hypothetical protein G6F52_010301 [Rhizopus delemar]KAG1587243.1 hypothetical protein G6F48_006061 [Rhizopus delemar]
MITMVDYTNLYIKNLDINVTSNDLFVLFRDFGEIISARVMKDPATGLSKGYGFVSFKHMEDAQEALIQMNGVLVQSKHIAVNYHEHRKTIQQYQKMQLERNGQLIKNTSNNNMMMTTTTIPTPIPRNEPIIYSTPNTTSYIPSEQHKNFIPYHEPAWISNTSNNMYPMHIPTSTITTTTTTSNTLPITMDDSMATNNQRQKLREAIDRHLLDHQKKDLDDILYLLQSLKKRELSLCLFNASYLKQQIDEAYKIIHLFSDQKQQQNSIATTPSLDHRHLVDDDDDSSPNSSSVAAILSSLEGMTLNKKKRVFGDVFFPYVKATGIRRAPKVTIRLLDTVPLDELAFDIYDKKELTKKALQAYAEIYGESSNAFREHH